MTTTHFIALLAAAVLWSAAVAYSRHRWPYLGCRTCGGTGRRFEPLVFTVLCLRRARAWRPCGACSGGGQRSRPKGLALR
ncbi:hypothetical protein GCM10027447_31960 [Glycomyces halotolerans]